MNTFSKHRRLLRAAPAALALLLAACGSTPTQPERPATPEPAAPVAPVPDHGDPQQRFDAALELMKNGQAAEAEQAFLALTKDFPQYAGPWTNLGIVYAKGKRRDAAINAFTRAVQIDPGNVVAFNWLGILNREAGQYDRARQAYERGLQAAPDDALTRLNYAVLLDVYLRQPQAAIEQYRKYQSVSGKENLAVTAWIAELEAKTRPAAPAAAPTEKTP